MAVILDDYIEIVSEKLKLFDSENNEFTELLFQSDYILKCGLGFLIDERNFSALKLMETMNSYIRNILSTRLVKSLNEHNKEILNKSGEIDNIKFVNYVYEYVLSLAFPKSVDAEFDENLDKRAEVFLIFYREWLNLERMLDQERFYNKYPLQFLTEKEIKGLPFNHEYKNFIKYFENEYVYEMMRLNQEIKGYSTLDHISGVSFVAANVARQLNELGFPIDVGNLIAAAIGHDIGKFGCRKNEEKRVPYLHYYYTDVWFKERECPYIANVASNHSTWDLELENLAAESLVLIYADFRVKNKHNNMHIYDLAESFEVILNKLDNVDESKEKRYRKVYAKLRDFENFLINHNIDVSMTEDGLKQVIENRKNRPVDMCLIQGDKIAENFKFQAIEYNINVLNKFSAIESFNEMLANISGEKNWKKLREYLTTLEEYYIYTSQIQKLYILNILKEMLLYKEEDVRNQSARIMGLLILDFDEEYKKEIPEDVSYGLQDITGAILFERYLDYFIYKDHKITQKHKEWLEINTKNFVLSVFKNNKTVEDYYGILEKIYLKILENKNVFSDITTAIIAQILKYIPVQDLENPETIIKFLKFMYNSESSEISISVAKSIYVILKNLSKTSSHYLEISNFVIENTVKSDDKIVDFIKYKLIMFIYENRKEPNLDYSKILKLDEITKQDISNIYLRNLKSATSWIEKKANIDLIAELTIQGKLTNNLQTVMHFCNLVKVSSTESVRNHAGKAMLAIFDLLERQEKNEACIELIRALEMQDLQFTKYIPEYIGKTLIYQEPGEFDEILDDFYYKVKTANAQIAWLLLLAVGYGIESYVSKGYKLEDDPEKYRLRLEKMVGILLVGLYSFDKYLSHESLKIISNNIFSSKELTLTQKYKIYRLVDKKIINTLKNREENKLLYLRNAASLNSIYRFISDYEFEYGNIRRINERQIAFFPGTFDPFSLGHKEIAKAIRDIGYDVYLSVDEFSWSKKTQPNNIRRKIIKVSIAEEAHIYTLPEDVQVNLSNDKDLENLKKVFKDSDLNIVVGSDVVLNASSYNGQNQGKILDFNHIIFYRRNKSDISEDEEKALLNEKIKAINANVEILSLPPQYEDISSTQIRNSIDEERDISELIDPLAQRFIYRYGLYKKEPRFKSYLSNVTLKTEVIDECTKEQLENLLDVCLEKDIISEIDRFSLLEKLSSYSHLRAIIVKDENTNQVLGFTTSSWLRSTEYYLEFRDKTISDYIRQKSIGRIVYINGLCVNKDARINNIYQIILTEALTVALEKDYTYCVYKNAVPTEDEMAQKIFELQGFEYIEGDDPKNKIQCVNMTQPIVLNLDLRSALKEPFRSNENIKKEIYRTRENLQSALGNLYRGELVLSFDRRVTYGKLIKKVCDINDVEYKVKKPRVLGENMCVPYGATLNGALIPNTVTKSLHTEKIFNSDLSRFKISEFPNYISMKNQVKLLSSFKRPVILIDDILHKGHRIRALDPLFREENIEIKQIVVAILSGQGKELMDIQQRQVEYIYFLPNLKNWFNENALYPFMGGDYVQRPDTSEEYILSSINFILPYASPGFVQNTDSKNIYKLSEVCMKNAISIFETIEKEYQILNERSFNLRKIGEVFQKPRKPDKGKCIEFDLDLKPSEYLKNDLEKLKRLKNIIYR